MKVAIGDVVRISRMLTAGGIPVETAIDIRSPDGWTSTFLPPPWGVSGVVMEITAIEPMGYFMYLVEIEDAGGRAEIHSSRVEEILRHATPPTPNNLGNSQKKGETVNAEIGDIVRIGASAFDNRVETKILIHHPDETRSRFRPPVFGEILEKKPSSISGTYIYRVKVNGGRAFIHSSRIEKILTASRCGLHDRPEPCERCSIYRSDYTSAEITLLLSALEKAGKTESENRELKRQLVMERDAANTQVALYRDGLEILRTKVKALKSEMEMTQNLLIAGATVYQRSTGQEMILDQKCRIGWGENSVEGWLAWDGRTFIRVPAADLTSTPTQAPSGTFHWPNWVGMMTVIGFATVLGHALTHYWMGR